MCGGPFKSPKIPTPDNSALEEARKKEEDAKQQVTREAEAVKRGRARFLNSSTGALGVAGDSLGARTNALF